MTLTLKDVPSATDAPASAEPSRVRVASTGLSRRKVLGSAAGVAVATGLGVLNLVPWSKPRLAWAAPYEEWPNDCRGYWNSSTTCVPSNAKFDGNCDGNAWHRNDGGSGTCYNFRFWHDGSSCDGRNAWRWYGRGNHRKCSDGWYEYNDCGGGHISTFSICRTAI